MSLRRFCLLALAVASVLAQPPPTAIVTTTAGQVQGLMSARYTGVSTFKGIPFGAPPTGALRFQPSLAAPAWPGVKQVTEFSDGCMQDCQLPRPAFTCPITMSEDCLYLNVFTPANFTATGNTTDSLPVLVFIHGGAFIAGAGGTPIYEASKLAHRQQIVVVTMNYRLSVFGALYLGTGVEGNFMLGDQRLALQWTINNIAAFGGNPNAITLGGESAGGISVGAHLVSPKSAGLFQAAYMSSNPYGLPMQNIELATALSQKILEGVNCPTGGTVASQLACLQQVPAETLVGAANTTHNAPLPSTVLAAMLPWVPVVVPGGQELPVQPFKAAGTSQTMNVPIFMGNNANDSVPFVNEMSSIPLAQPIIDAALIYVFGLENAIEIRLTYGDCDCSDARLWFSKIATDYIFYCSGRNVLNRIVAAPNAAPVYSYVFGHLPSFSTWMWNDQDPLCDNHICHADDLPFVFGNMYIPGHVTPTPTSNEKILIDWTQEALGSFVRNVGQKINPSLGWTPYSSSALNIEYIDVMGNGTVLPWMEYGFKAGYCDFWDGVGYNRR